MSIDNAKTIFLNALEIASSEARHAYLGAQCGNDPSLRAEVEELLQHHAKIGPLGESASVVGTTPPPNFERPGTVIGPYKLLQQIGEGGMGTVYMAEQTHPVQRKVALKVIKPGMDSDQVIARFEVERQALALMDHPNIAKVLDAGTTAAGRPYFVMELVKGVPITTYCDENHLPPKARLELFTQVCQAVQHAHHKGVIHRDLKPNNVLVALYDDKPVPKVIDFGVAKATGGKLTERTMFTGYGQIVGTLEYMSPEQARLNALDIDTRGDIYSLGVLLYELLTGTTPLDKKRLREAAFDEMLRIVREEEPPKPSTRLSTAEGRASIAANRSMEPNKLSGLVRGELDWIVMKALDKDRNRRYETANGLAMDIQRYLCDEQVLACPPSASYRLRKVIHRNKAAIVMASVIVAALVLGTVVSTWQAIRATKAEVLAEERFEGEKEARHVAERAKQEAVGERNVAQRRLFDARLAEARAGRRSKQVGQRIDSLNALAEASDLARKLDMNRSAWAALRNETIACLGLTDFRMVHEQVARIPYLTDWTAFDPTLEHYAINDSRGLILVRRTDNNQEVARLIGPVKRDYPGLFSPDGKWLAARGFGGPRSLVVWDWRKGEMLLETEHDQLGARCPLAFTPDSRQLAVGKSKSISVFDLTTRKEVQSIATPVRPGSIAFAPDGIRLAVGSANNREVRIYDLTADKVLRTLSEADTTYDLAWHPNGQVLAASGVDKCIHVWNVSTGKKHAVLRGHQSVAWSLGFAANDGLLVSTSWDRTVRLWNVTSGQEIFRFAGTKGQWSQDGRRLGVRVDQNVQVWERADAATYSVLPGEAASGTVNFGRNLSPDGRWLAVGHTEGLRLFDLAIGKQAAFLPVGPTVSAFFLPPGNELLTSGPKGLYRWPFRVEKDTLHIGPRRKMSGASGHLATDNQGKSLLVGIQGLDRVAILDLDDVDAKPRQLDHASVGSVALSPDGRWAITGSHNGWGVRIFDAATGKQLIRPLLSQDRITVVGIRPDGQQFVTSTRQGPELGTIWWETDSWKELRRVPEHGQFAWSPDGRLFAQSSDNYRVRLLDGEGKRELATLEAPDDVQAGGLLFTPDGSRLILMAGEPALVRVWDLRLVRRELAKIGLDWDAPPYPPAKAPDAAETRAIKVEVDLSDSVEQAARQKETQGDKHRVQKEYAQAIAYYREVLQSEPHNAGILNRAAWLLAIGPPEVRDGQDALRLMERACAWDPASAYYANTLGAAQYRAGQYAEALRSLRQAEKQLGDNKGFTWPHNWVVQALCLAKLGQRDVASAAYQKSVEWLKDPGTRNTVYCNEAELLRSEMEALLQEIK